MSRNRFELLMRMLHFNNEAERNPDDRLYKLTPLISQLVPRYVPDEEFCIDESNIPWRGRLNFRQYLPNKRHKYGIKVYKLCCRGGYVWGLKVYTGRELLNRSNPNSISEDVVLTLSEELLNQGRTVYADNWYCSVSLANKLLAKDTHLVGTLRSNRRQNPEDVVRARLRKGEVTSIHHNNLGNKFLPKFHE